MYLLVDILGGTPDGDLLMGTQHTTAAIKQDFSRRLSKALRDKGWSQSELARHAGKYTKKGKLGRYSVSLYVKGRMLPQPERLNAIAKALGVKAEELLPVQKSSLANT